MVTILADNVMEQLHCYINTSNKAVFLVLNLVVEQDTMRHYVHCHINPYFSHVGRMGIPLALAILTIQIYRHNIKKEKNNSLVRFFITAALSEVSQHTINRHFGIMEKEDGGVINHWFLRSMENTEQYGEVCKLEEDPSLISVTTYQGKL